MRKDMSKIIVERPRYLSKWFKEHKTHWDPEEAPSKEGMRPKNSYDRKQLNENLAPLKRFLERNVGRPWNKVFSEICQNINIKSAVQNHIREHVDQYVHKSVEIEGKKIFSPIWAKYGSEPSRYQLNEEFYVHPKKGTLELSPRREYPVPPPNPNVKKLSDTEWLIREKGIWYEALLGWKLDWGWLGRTWKAIQQEKYSKPWIKRRASEVLDVTSKRQLNKKELRLYGLR